MITHVAGGGRMIRTVLGADPGATTGLARIDLDGFREPLLIQVTDPAQVLAAMDDLVGAQGPDEVLFAIEQFVVGYRSARSSTPKAGRTTRDLIGALQLWALDRGIRVVLRSASQVKPWATNTRLRAAGLYVKGAPHSRDAARHALHAAVSDAGFPDPLSSRASSQR
jgi:hypothetical protein